MLLKLGLGRGREARERERKASKKAFGRANPEPQNLKPENRKPKLGAVANLDFEDKAEVKALQVQD